MPGQPITRLKRLNALSQQRKDLMQDPQSQEILNFTKTQILKLFNNLKQKANDPTTQDPKNDALMAAFILILQILVQQTEHGLIEANNLYAWLRELAAIIPNMKYPKTTPKPTTKGLPKM